MSKFHRIALAAVALAGTVLLAAPAGSASAAAASSERKVVIDVTFTVTDDDIFSDTTVTSHRTQTVFVSDASPVTTAVFKSDCAGDEVRGELALRIGLRSNGAVYVDDSVVNHVLGLRLYEGAEGVGCPFDDLDGNQNITDLAIPRGLGASSSASVGNQQEGGEDFVSVTYAVNNFAG
jgi:hypothetical protein